jgi:protein TonB
MVGKWIFYHPNGKPSAQEFYERGKKVTQQYFTEDGMPIADTTNTDREAGFPGKTAGWRRYLERNMNPMVPANLGAPNGQFTVAVRFVVNKDGTLEDLEPLTSHGYGMEEEVLRLIRKRPRWEPARMHNRLVRAYRIQPVTFVITGK